MPSKARSPVGGWNAFELLEIYNPVKCSITCVGWAPSQGRRCWNPIAQHNIAAAKDMLRTLECQSMDSEDLSAHLEELAELLLCRRYHQHQAATVAEKWEKEVVAELPRGHSTGDNCSCNSTPKPRGTSASPSNSDLMNEIAKLRRELEELKRQHSTAGFQNTSAGTRSSRTPEGSPESRSSSNDDHSTGDSNQAQSERAQRGQDEARREEVRQKEARREEARRQADRARKQQEADARQRKEREEVRRRAEELKERREREARERAEKEEQSWKEAWVRYERDWANLGRMNTADLDEDVKDSLPWPVKDGNAHDVNETNVYSFLRHAPDDVWNRPSEFMKVLMAQTLRWHPDRICRQFPSLIGEEEVTSLVTLVTQVLNRERAQTLQRMKLGQ